MTHPVVALNFCMGCFLQAGSLVENVIQPISDDDGY